MADAMFFEHTIEPYCPSDASVLILGTFPSPKSREMGFYYGHPRNRFWKMLAHIFEEKEPLTVNDRKAFLDRHQIALWDVLASCRIVGASDATISHAVVNDLPLLLRKAPIKLIITTGKKAGDLFTRQWGSRLQIPMLNLPSTSPANCCFSLQQLEESYQLIKEYI